MIQQPALRYTLIVRGKENILPNSPEGWENSLITIKRSETKYGTMRSFTVDMDFVLDGAWILRTEFYRFGIEGEVSFRIEEWNPATWLYDNIYQGEIDFSNIKDYSELDGYKFTANVMEAGLSSLLAAHEDTEFTIPIDVPEAVYIQYPGIQLKEEALMSFEPNTSITADYFPTINVIQNQQNSKVNSVQRVEYYQITDPNFNTIDKWFFRPQVDGILTMRGLLKFFVVSNPGVSTFDISIYRNGSGIPAYTLYHEAVTGSPPEKSVSLDYDIPVSAGQVLYFYFDSNRDGAGGQGFSITYGQFSLSYKTITAPSVHKALPAYYVYQQIINKIWQTKYTAQTYPVQSYLLQSEWVQMCLTSGDAFRLPLDEYEYFDETDELTSGAYYVVTGTQGSIQYNGIIYPIGGVFRAVDAASFFTTISGDAIVAITYSPAAIKTSFKDLFKTIDAITCAGFADMNGVAVLESRKSFFQAGLQAANLGKVAKYNLTPYTQWMYSTIIGGYPDQTYDTLNGRYEVMSEVQWTTPITRVQNEYDIRSSYRADPYGIEFARIQYDDSSVTNADNSVFVVIRRSELEAGQVYYRPEGSEAFLSVSGVESGYFNMRISPKANLLRHSYWLASFLYQRTGVIQVSSAKKNTSLVTVGMDGVRIAEGEIIEVGSLGTALFIPYNMTVNSKLPRDVAKVVRETPNGRIDFEADEVSYSGFVLQVSTDPAMNSDRELQLLVVAGTELTPLVR